MCFENAHKGTVLFCANLGRSEGVSFEMVEGLVGGGEGWEILGERGNWRCD